MTSNDIDSSLANRAQKSGRAKLLRAWDKARDRLESDVDGAITAAKTLLESTCKHVLDVLSVPYEAAFDLPKLYGLAATALGISAAGDVARLQKQFFGATYTLVQSVGELRNKVGDAHGKGQQSISPSRAQGELAVSVAGSMAIFLLATLDSHLAATKRLTVDGDALLWFDKSTVWRLVDHATNAEGHLKALGERRPRPALWLVGDAGVYLMSNGKPPLLHDGKIVDSKDASGKPRLVAYAEGCGVIDDVDDWWPIHNAIAGGDDFVETLPLARVRPALEGAESRIVVVIGRNEYSIYADVEFASTGAAGH